MKKIKNKRINNLEFGTATYIMETPKDPDYEICRWVPNQYYGREKNFIKDGDYYIYPKFPNCRVHKDCFKYPETRYTIAFFRKREDEDYEFEFLGDRPLDMTTEELPDFWELIKYGFEVLNNSEDEKRRTTRNFNRVTKSPNGTF